MGHPSRTLDGNFRKRSQGSFRNFSEFLPESASRTGGMARTCRGDQAWNIQGPLKGGVSKRGGFPIWTCPSFFVFLSFLGLSRCSRFVRDLPDLLGDGPGILGLLRAPTRNSPERVRDTIWTFPEKSGKPPGLKTPRFSFSQNMFGTSLHTSYYKGSMAPQTHRPLDGVF